jgi:superfamily II DNA or RNA helicase
MLPSSALATEFTRLIRNRGEEYVQGGLIEILSGSPSDVAALAQGSSIYAVTITRIPEGVETRFEASCTCPYFIDHGHACKHVWATIRVAERAGHLLASDGATLDRGSAYLELVDPLHDAEDLLESLEGTGGLPARAARPGPAQPPSPSSRVLTNLEQALSVSEQGAIAAFPYADATLLYVIDSTVTPGPATAVTVMYQRRAKAGGLNKPKVAKLSASDIARAPQADRRILAMLAGTDREPPWIGWTPAADLRAAASFFLPPPLALELIPMIARTARLWLRARPDLADIDPLAWDDGSPWRFRAVVDPVDAGFRVGGLLHRDTVLVPLTESFRIVAGGLIALRGTLARFEAGAETALLDVLRASGPIDVPAPEAPRLAHVLARSGVASDALPEALRVTDVRVTPTPRLSLQRRLDVNPKWLTARLSFDYDGTLVDRTTAGTTIFDAPRQRLVHRDPARESAAWNRLVGQGFRIGWGVVGQELEVATKSLASVARALVADGWYVEAEGQPYRAIANVRLSVSSGIDWFDLTASVDFGEATVPLADVLAALRPGATTVRLGDGSVGILPEDWLARYGALAASGQVEGERIRFGRSQAALLDALLANREADTAIEVDTTFTRAREELSGFDQVAALPPPASFKGSLRPYQQEGLGWFAFLRRFGFGGCLADDMGLGKTIMVLALLEARRTEPCAGGEPARPSLVVVPRSLVGNWMAEAARFTPDLRVVDHSHALRSTDPAALSAHDVVIVTYGTLRRDIADLSAIAFDYVVLDEAQAIKNAATASAKAVRLLRARHRLALSGTPIENHLGELWSLFEFLNPGVLGRSSVFQRMTSAGGDSLEMTETLSRGLRPFILRRTKQQVASELPARTEQTIACELSAKERALYESLRRHYRDALLHRVARDGIAKSKMHVLEALLRLRQAACHPGLIDRARRSDGSAKFEVLVPRLREVLAEGHKTLVFSQFTTLLGLLREALDAEGLRYEYLDGKTKDRAARVSRFQEDPRAGLFLISLKAGGLGLNLTAAEYVFLLDPWWNPAVEAQAIDRAHRIGQTREVFAYRLIATNTVEEKVLALQQSKRALADAVLSADAVGLRHLKREDLELLLS